MTPLDVVAPMAAIAGVGVVIDSAEVLVAHSALAPSGLYSWDVLGLGRHYLVDGPLARPLSRVFRYPQVLVLPVFQLLCAPVLLLAPLMSSNLVAPAVAIAALGTAAARMLFAMRQQLGLDGSDQMLVIALVAAGFGAVFCNTAAGNAAVDYAALQLLLSYVISGTAKAVSLTWRSGWAIVGITGTIGYGNVKLHTVLYRYPLVARAVCWSVIIFECSAAILILFGVKGAWVIILAGTCFHIGVAVVMGLNVFFWAFSASYPALILLGTQVDQLFGR